MFKSLFKAAIGVTVHLPLSVLADTITLGGVLTENERPYTSDAIGLIFKNVKESVIDEDEK